MHGCLLHHDTSAVSSLLLVLLLLLGIGHVCAGRKAKQHLMSCRRRKTSRYFQPCCLLYLGHSYTATAQMHQQHSGSCIATVQRRKDGSNTSSRVVCQSVEQQQSCHSSSRCQCFSTAGLRCPYEFPLATHVLQPAVASSSTANSTSKQAALQPCSCPGASP